MPLQQAEGLPRTLQTLEKVGGKDPYGGRSNPTSAVLCEWPGGKVGTPAAAVRGEILTRCLSGQDPRHASSIPPLGVYYSCRETSDRWEPL